MVRLLLAAGADRAARDKVGTGAAVPYGVWRAGRRKAGSWVPHRWHAYLAGCGAGPSRSAWPKAVCCGIWGYGMVWYGIRFTR